MSHNATVNTADFTYSPNNDYITLQNVQTSTLPVLTEPTCTVPLNILTEILNEMKSLKTEVSELKTEVSELKREMQQNKISMTKLTEEVIAVKLESRQHHKGPVFLHSRQFDKLPFNTQDDLKMFDEELKKNEEMLEQFKKFISKLGGDGQSQFLRAAVRKVFTDELAKEFSWKGTKDKPSAEKCFCIYIIKNIAHVKFVCDDKEMNAILQKHFVHAKERVTKKRKRSEINNNTTNTN